MTAADDSPTGERLAAWLEGLGLVEQLPEAGLPTLARDEEGRPVWTDPGTGRPLDDRQLADLDRLLHNEGAEPEHAVPLALVLLARQARVREQLLATPWWDYDGLAAVRGTSVNATRFAVHKAAAEHRFLVVPHGSGVIVPAFQATAGGELRPELLDVLRPLLAAGTDPWRVWAWLTQPVALLGGLVPELAVRTDPALVRAAALRLAERATSA